MENIKYICKICNKEEKYKNRYRKSLCNNCYTMLRHTVRSYEKNHEGEILKTDTFEKIKLIFKNKDEGLYDNVKGRPKRVIVYDKDGSKKKFLDNLETVKLRYNYKIDYEDARLSLCILSELEKQYDKSFKDISRRQLINEIKNSTNTNGNIFATKSLEKYFVGLNLYEKWISNKDREDELYFSDSNLKADMNYMKVSTYNDIIQDLQPTEESFFKLLDEADIKLQDKMVVALVYEGLTLQEILDIEINDCTSIESKQIICSREYNNISNKTMEYIKENIDNPIDHYMENDKKFLLKRGKSANEKRRIQIINSAISRYNIYLKSANNGKKVNHHLIYRNCAYHQISLRELLYRRDLTKKEFNDIIKQYQVIQYKEETSKAFEDEFSYYKEFKIVYKEQLEAIPMKILQDNKKTIIDNRMKFKVKAAKRNDDAIANPIGQQKLTRGKLGEEYILLKLREAGYTENNAHKVKDVSGFDIQILDGNNIPLQHIEIKTVHNFTDSIIVTEHELEVAALEKEIYYIYVVKLQNDIEKVEEIPINTPFIIIKNPIKAFDINLVKLQERFKKNTRKCKIESKSFIIKEWVTSEDERHIKIIKNE